MRYVPGTLKDQQSMLAFSGKKTIGELFDSVPEKVKLKARLPLPAPLSEPELLSALCAASEKNELPSNFIGGGTYNHFIPSVVKHLTGRSEFYTAYTPYQAEASQGILQSIYEYQTMICNLTGMDAANASMYDGATALAEAALLACRFTQKNEIAVSAAVHPGYRSVLGTYARGAGLKVTEVPYDKESGLTSDPEPFISGRTACLIYQQPNFFGCLETIKKLSPLLVVSADPISLGILKAPGDYGADIVVGEGQALGNSVSFGGPGLGIFAVKKALIRLMPGRIAGMTVDSEGKRGFCLTLQTREQHIRRDRATSNICSNEALAALAAAIYLAIMGKEGLRTVAKLCLQKAGYLKNKLYKISAFSAPTFKEFVVRTKKDVGLNLTNFYPELKGCRLIGATELVKKEALDFLLSELL